MKKDFCKPKKKKSPIRFGDQDQTVILAQGKVFDYRRLKEKFGELGEHESQKIREGYSVLHAPFKNRPSSVARGGRG